MNKSAIMVSIITVTYNCGDALIKTIKSIENQKNKNFEYIVIDGQSDEPTYKIIKSYSHIIDKLIIEKDKGIYDAMNKGIKISDGKLLVFINAGDSLINDDYIGLIINIYEKNKYDLLYGDVLLEYKNKTVYKKHPSKINFKYLSVNTICHQAIVFNKEIFDKFGNYNISEKIFADFEHLLKLYLNNVDFQYVNLPLVFFDMEGISSSNYFINNFISRTNIVKKQVNNFRLIIYMIFYLIYKPIDLLKFKINKTYGVKYK